MDEPTAFAFNDFPRTVLKVAAVLGVAGVVVGLSYFAIRGPREVVAILPIDADNAVVLMNKGGGELLMRVNARDGAQWSVDLPAFRPDMVRAGASVGGGVVTVRGFAHLNLSYDTLDEKQRTVETYAWNSETGDPLWVGADSGLPMKSAVAPPYVSNLADDADLYEIHITKPHTVVGVDRRTGVESLRSAIPEERTDLDAIVRAWLRPNYVIIDQPASFAFVDRRSGEVHAARARQWPCVLEDTVYFEPEDGTALVKRSLTDLHDESLFELAGSLAGQCGRWGSDTVMAVDDDYTTDLLAINAQGQPSWTVDLGGWSIDAPNNRDVRTSYAEMTPLSGTATRYVPFLAVDWAMSKKELPAKSGLVVVDLQEHRIAWTATNPELSQYQLIRTGDRFVLIRGNQLIALDGATGLPYGAIRIDGAHPILPYQFIDGRVWVAGPRVARVLDLATLKFADDGWGWGPLEIVDISKEAQTMLGLDAK